MAAQVVEDLAAEFCGSSADVTLVRRFHHLLKLVHWERLEFSDRCLRQALLCKVCDPVRDIVRCTLRLQLQNGILHGLICRGSSAAIVDSLPALARCLLELHGTPLRPDAIEQALSKSLQAAGHGQVMVQFEQNSTVLPLMPVSATMHAKLSLFGLNRMRQQQGLSSLEHLPQALADAICLDDPHQGLAAQAYLHGLEAPALEYCCENFGGARAPLLVYNFLAGEDGRYCRNRIQAVRVLPWLLPALTEVVESAQQGREKSGHVWQSCIEQIQQAIDLGRPLFQSIAAALDLPVETVRWLGRRSLPIDWRLDIRRVALLLRLLSWLAPEQRPVDVQGYTCLVNMGNAFLGAFQRLSIFEFTLDLRRPQYACMFRRWSPVLAEASANEQEFGLLQRRLADAADFVSAALAALAEPQPGQKANQELAMHELLERLCKLSLRRFLAHSHEWHTGQLHIQQRERDAGENGGELQCWPQVLTTPWRYQDVLITELGDSHSLQLEGLAMQHCVGGYSEACASGNSLVFSLATADGTRLSTAELKLIDDGRELVVCQHRAVSNGPAPGHCVVALAALVSYLNHPDFRMLRLERYRIQQAQRRIQAQQLNERLSARVRRQREFQTLALRILMPARH